MKKLASNLTYRTTKSGLPFPEKALVVYIMVNPIDLLSGYFVFQERMNYAIKEHYKATQNGNTPNRNDIKNIDHVFMTSLGKAARERDFLDIDLDSKEDSVLEEFKSDLKGYEYHLVSTQGGYHLLIPLKQKNFPAIHKTITRVKQDFSVNEIMVNKNAMVPLAGTLQAGKLVTIDSV